MPLVRAIARDASKANGRFSALVLGVVKSRPFQMNTRSAPLATLPEIASGAPRTGAQ